MRRVITDPKPIAGRRSCKKPVPDDRIAVISLSDESRPKAIRVATNTAMGTAKAKIHARFKNINSPKRNISNPLPKNLSILFSKKLDKSTNRSTNSAIMNGGICSFTIYLERILMT
tara:strand:+ start:121 stop:468 length:348 start_codon:yes stop_codon:yes gene_type:complete